MNGYMKYRIEIWQWHNMVEAYESDNIENVLLWYKTEGWCSAYDNGLCSIGVYVDGRGLSFDEGYELGFY
jgi:hypothetical protein